MPRGGARPGAGRKRGKPNRKNEITIARVEEMADKDPLDVMVYAQNVYFGAHEKAVEAEDFPKALNYLERACHWAEKVAPYKHGRLSGIDPNLGDKEERVSLADRLRAIAAA